MLRERFPDMNMQEYVQRNHHFSKAIKKKKIFWLYWSLTHKWKGKKKGLKLTFLIIRSHKVDTEQSCRKKQLKLYWLWDKEFDHWQNKKWFKARLHEILIFVQHFSECFPQFLLLN